MMPWADAHKLARQGKRVRRLGWPSNRWLTYIPAGRGAAVAQQSQNTQSGLVVTTNIVRAQDFGLTDYSADDWMEV